jgi:hypothetical protein
MSSSWAYQLREMSIEEGLRQQLQRRVRFVIGAAVGTACRLGMVSDEGR